MLLLYLVEDAYSPLKAYKSLNHYHRAVTDLGSKLENSLTRNEIVPFIEMWIDLETVIQVKSETEKQMSYNITYMWNPEKWYIQMGLFAKKKQRYRCRKIYGYQGGGSGRWKELGDWE